MGSEQADDAGPLRVQNIPVVVSDHLVQLQDPAVGRGRGEIERSELMKQVMERNQDGRGGLSRATEESRSGHTLVAVVDLGGDFLLQLLELVAGQRARQELRTPLH